MSIFLCDGLCERCEAQEECPLKHKEDERDDRRMLETLLAVLPIELAKKQYEEYIELKNNLTPENVTKNMLDGGLYGLIQYFSIMKEENRVEKHIVVESLKNTLPPSIRMTLEEDNLLPLAKRLLRVLKEIANDIVALLNEQCIESCNEECYLKRHCPKK